MHADRRRRPRLPRDGGRRNTLVHLIKDAARTGHDERRALLSASGVRVYMVDVTQIRMARLIFQYEHATDPLVVRVPKDGAAPSVEVGLPRQIDLDQPRAIEVTVRSGRNDIDMAEVSIASEDGAALVDYGGVSLSKDAQENSSKIESCTESSTCVTIKALPKDSRVVLVLPLLQLPDTGLLDAVVVLTYTNERIASSPRRQKTHAQNTSTASNSASTRRQRTRLLPHLSPLFQVHHLRGRGWQHSTPTGYDGAR